MDFFQNRFMISFIQNSLLNFTYSFRNCSSVFIRDFSRDSSRILSSAFFRHSFKNSVKILRKVCYELLVKLCRGFCVMFILKIFQFCLEIHCRNLPEISSGAPRESPMEVPTEMCAGISLGFHPENFCRYLSRDFY